MNQKPEPTSKEQPTILMQACQEQNLTLAPGMGIYTETGDLLLAASDGPTWWYFYLPGTEGQAGVDHVLSEVKYREGTSIYQQLCIYLGTGGDAPMVKRESCGAVIADLRKFVEVCWYIHTHTHIREGDQ